MRVIAGTMRGLKLSAPDGMNTRPTLDRVREAVFSMLMPYLNDAVILDLFAGSGAMGIEALSRGASEAVFVDSDRSSIACINNNIRSSKAEERAHVILSDAHKYLSDCNKSFDIIFLDPPYFDNVYSTILDMIAKNNVLSPEGIIVVEWDYETGFSYNCDMFSVIKEKKYGRVGITTLKRG